jgi:magnesium-protoporphyrin IX monomethyl ester (oxidative) cyclase|tara:strand:+ start:268 stop:1788 length:1521 start_codon:yes stop_codon:yes gene_type:complete
MKRTKVLLINPPYLQRTARKRDVNIVLPLSLAYIAAVLEKNDYKVSIIDSAVEADIEHVKDDIFHVGLSFEALKERIKQEQPDVVGVSCPFPIRMKFAIETSKIIKEVNPKIKVFMGGIHPSINYADFLNTGYIDYILIAEAEYTTLDLVNHIENNNLDMEDIDGIAYKADGEVKKNPKTKFIKNPSELPWPARHLLKVDRYFKNTAVRWDRKSMKEMSVITSRSCHQRCKFCSVHLVGGPTWRPRDPIDVVDEMEHLVKKYGAKEIALEDDNPTVSRERTKIMCNEIIKRKLNIYWKIPAGVSIRTLDREVLELMKKSGCYSLNLPIESGDDYMLNKVMNKQLPISKVSEIANIAHELGFILNSYWIIGMPGETPKSIRNSIELAKELPLDKISVLMPSVLPGTEFYNECIKNGYIDKEEHMKNITDHNLALFSDYMIKIPTMTHEELAKYREIFYREFTMSKLKKRPLSFLYLIKRDPAALLKVPKVLANLVTSFSKKLISGTD